MKIESLAPGMIVYDVGKTKMGNTTMSTVSVWTVSIISIDFDKREVTASWNCNPPWTYGERRWSKWRKNMPKLISMPFGRKRLARRGE